MKKIILWPLRIAGSMYFAVALIAILSVVMGWATFVDREYGAEASMFGIYSSWWFILLFALLGLSVIVSAALRFPWKRHQTGFLVTHAGIIMLLTGCWLTLMQGKSATLGIWEGGENDVAVSRASVLVLERFSQDPEEKYLADIRNYASGKLDFAAVTPLEPAHTTLVRFRPGPFTWSFYNTGPVFGFKKSDQLPAFPWSLAGSDRGSGVMYDHEGVKLEVLDYRDSVRMQRPAVNPEIIFVPGEAEKSDSASKTGEAAKNAEVMELNPQERNLLAGGISVVYMKTENAAEVAAFRACVPDMTALPTGDDALVTLYVAGKMHAFPLSTLENGQPAPLAGTDWTVRLLRADKYLYITALELRNTKNENAPPLMLNLFAEMPERCQQLPGEGIFGWVWLRKLGVLPETAAADSPEMMRMAQTIQARQRPPRVELMLGPDGVLYGKTWHRPVCETFTLTETDPAAIFAKDEKLAGTLTLAPKETPELDGYALVPQPLTKITEHTQQMLTRAVKVRLTVDGHAEERWVCGQDNNRMIPAAPPQAPEVLTVKGENRWVSFSLRYEEIVLGFKLRLNRFNHRLDPGTSTAAGYSSDVTLLDAQHPENNRDLQIIINQPVDFYDARAKHNWRVYQSSFNGPYTPDSPVFQAHVPADSPRQQLYLSLFSISYDPGRGLLYLGCFLIITGIAVMFYMRAYFFGARTAE